MSDEQRRPDSQKSRQELLDEIYYLRDVAGQREQQVRLLQARIDRTLRGRLWRWAGPLRRLVRAVRRPGSSGKRMASNVSARGRDGEDGPRLQTKSLATETRNGDEKHLFVDVSALVLSGGMTGVQRVTREIVGALLAAPPRGFAVRPVYAASGLPYRLLLARQSREGGNPEPSDVNRSNPLDPDLLGAGGDYSEISSPVDARGGDVFLGLDHSLQAVVERERDLDAMHRRGVRLWFVCNDTLPLDHPEWFPPDLQPAFEAWLRAILRTADGVACISQTTEAGVSRWLDTWNIKRDRSLILGHFALGAAPSVHTREATTISDEESALLERLRGKTAFLMVGTLEPRKGHAQALETFNRLWAGGEDVLLVIAGLPGWITEVTQRRIRHHEEFGKRLFWFMRASDALLEKLYATCTVLLAPSEGEGFGLPLVEAAQHGLPILCRDLPVFREVAGEFATYFSGNQAGALADAVEGWLEEHQEGRTITSATMPRLTWAESAQQLLGVVLDACMAASSANVKQGSSHS